MTIPHSISEACVTIAGVKLVVHNLSNGERIIESEGLEALFAAIENGNPLNSEDAMKMAKIIRPTGEA